MTKSTSNPLNRRTYLHATASIAGAVCGVSSASAAGASDNTVQVGSIEPSAFVLEQGDTCVPFAIVTSNLPVETFYNYRSSDTDPKGWYSSYGPAATLEQAENSVLYLYRGPKGTSLVFMHGKRGSEDGGSVTFHLSGLPTDGTWAVTDDQYDASTNYDTFDGSDGEWTVDWTWASDSQHGGGADGGAFRGVTRDDTVTINPAFNEAARLYGRHEDRNYVGQVENWNALSADSEGHQWQSLDMTQSVIIHAGSCGGSGTTDPTEPTQTTSESRTTGTPTDSRTGETTSDSQTTAGTTSDSANGPRDSGSGTKNTTSDGQDGLGALTALSGLIGTGLSLYRFRDER